MTNSLTHSLEKAFRCQVQGLKPRRNVYVAKTDKGVWIIKGYDHREKAEHVAQLAQVLREKGFTHTVRYLPTYDGEIVLPIGSKYYTIMKAIDGREANHTSLLDIKKSAATLAHFHQTAQGFTAPASMLDTEAPLIQKWRERLTQFERIVGSINKRGPQNRLEQLISSSAEMVQRDARDALNIASSMQLEWEMEFAYVTGTMAHRDVASHNFLLTDRGSCYLIDLDTVSFDMQLVDLVQFMGRMLLLQGYSLQAFTEAIEAYSKVNHLGDTQILMIHQLLRYPDNFLREVTGIYAKRPGYRMRGVMQLLHLERRFSQERQHLLAGEAQLFHHPIWEQHDIVGF